MTFEEIEERARELFSHANPDIEWYFLDEEDKNYWRKLAIEESEGRQRAEQSMHGYPRAGESAMPHVSYSQLRSNLASYLDKVCDDHTPIFVTRQNARSVVLISEEDYEGLMETVHLLKSPANAARLLRSIKEANKDKLKERNMIEPGGCSQTKDGGAPH